LDRDVYREEKKVQDNENEMGKRLERCSI